MRRNFRNINLVVVFTLLVFSFQNCTSSFSSDNPLGLQQPGSKGHFASNAGGGGGNGEPYGGKPGYYSLAVGYSCRASDGSEIPAPMGKIEEENGEMYLSFADCQEKKVKLAGTEIEIDPQNSQVLVYRNKSFIHYGIPPALHSKNFFFPESICRETQESVQRRAGTTGVILDQPGESVVENILETNLEVNWFGDRKANMASFDHTRIYRDPQSPVQMPPPPQLKWRHSFLNLMKESIVDGWHWFSDVFDVQVANRTPIAGASTNTMQGEMSFITPQGDDLNVPVQCIILKN